MTTGLVRFQPKKGSPFSPNWTITHIYSTYIPFFTNFFSYSNLNIFHTISSKFHWNFNFCSFFFAFFAKVFPTPLNTTNKSITCCKLEPKAKNPKGSHPIHTGGNPKIVGPLKWMVKIMENPIKMDSGAREWTQNYLAYCFFKHAAFLGNLYLDQPKSLKRLGHSWEESTWLKITPWHFRKIFGFAEGVFGKK